MDSPQHTNRPPHTADTPSLTQQVGSFAKLIKDNLTHRQDPNFTPTVSPAYEVIARGLDKTQAAIVTLLVQAIIGRNLLGGKLTSLSLGKVHISGKTLMGINRGSYVSALYLLGGLGIDGTKLLRDAVKQLSLDPLYAGTSRNQLTELAIGLICYALSRAITLFQTGNDWSHLWEKYGKK